MYDTRTPYDIDNLNMAIINIPCSQSHVYFGTAGEYYAYKEGHREARHAAIEAVLEHFKDVAEPSVAAGDAIPKSAVLVDGVWHVPLHLMQQPSATAWTDAVQHLQNVAADAVPMLSHDWTKTSMLLKHAVEQIATLASPAVSQKAAPEARTDNEGIWSWERRAAAAEAFMRNYADTQMEELLAGYHVQPIIRRLAAAIKEWQTDVIREAPDGVVGIEIPAPATQQAGAAVSVNCYGDAVDNSAATTASASGDVQADFEARARSHGGLPLDLAGDAMRTDDGLALPTYKFGRTEIAWRAFANRRAPAPSRDAAPLDVNTERETVARAICTACGEVPDHIGDAQGNAFRWQDYLEIADAAMAAMDTADTSVATTAPVSSPIGEDIADISLPALPRPDCTYADHSYPAYSKKAVEQIIAPYAARIRQLERELLQLKQINT